GLWACGEVASTGVHGANRLASTSLLENLVFAARVVDAIVAGKDSPDATGVLRGVVDIAVPESPLHANISPGPAIRDDLQRVMTRYVGVVRSAEGLARAWSQLGALPPTNIEEANLLAVSQALVRAATLREESRGTHTRADYPE